MHQVLAGENSHFDILGQNFRSFLQLAWLLNRNGPGPAEKAGEKKGRMEMSGQSQFTRTLVAIAAALFMSSVTVGAAVGPAQAVASPSQVALSA